MSYYTVVAEVIEVIKQYLNRDKVTSDESDFPARPEDYVSSRSPSDGFPDRPDDYKTDQSVEDGFPTQPEF